MIRGPLIWAIGLIGSVALHAVAAVVLLWSVEPEPVTEQPVPETRMQLSAHQVRQSEAIETRPDADTMRAEDTAGARLDQGAIQQSVAVAVALAQRPVTAQQPDSDPLAPVDQASDRVEPLTAAAEPLAALTQAAQTLQPSAALPVSAVAITAAPTQAVALADPVPEAALALQAQPVALSATQPDVPKARASDVFSTTGDGPIDPVSLAAIQSFMRPEDAGQSAQDLRDGVQGVLSQVPCSRLQVQFQPETNTLEVIGHIPEDGLRAPTLAALQAQMGDNIRVADNLLILPRPQCGALSGIADVGLPQSTDQFTNPRLIGEDVHAREFRYVQGQQLVLDLTGADYDAYVYVDYFDADGQVIHLSPNNSTPLELTPAKSPLRIGAQAEGDPGLYITIGPPYGQEIAVAFAASAPLYQDERPLIEPADTYLSFLKSRITAARAENPDFKGEWVYFFIKTAAQ